MQQDNFSIIVLNHNNIYIKQCIKSIQANKNKNDEIIIVDDHSTESNYTDLLNSFGSECTILQNREFPHNVSYNRNLGADHAKNEYLLFLDGDAFVYNDCIDQLRFSLHAKDVVCATLYADGMSNAPLQLQLVYKEDFRNALKSEELATLCSKHFMKDFRRSLSMDSLQGYHNWIYYYGICLAVKKSAFLAAGKFDISLSGWGMEDIDFTYRLRKYGKLQFIAQAQLFHIPHTRNRYKNHEQNAYNFMRCLKKYDGETEWEISYKLRSIAEALSVLNNIIYIHRDVEQQFSATLEDDCIYIHAISGKFPQGNIKMINNRKSYTLKHIGLSIPVRNKQFKKCYLSIYVLNYPAPILSLLLQEACRVASEVLIYKVDFYPAVRWSKDIEVKCDAHSQRFDVSPVKLSDFTFEDIGSFYKITTGLPDTPYKDSEEVYYEFI